MAYSDYSQVWSRIHNFPERKLYVPASGFTHESVTDFRRSGPNQENLRFRDEWRLPQAHRQLHISWIETITFVVDLDNMSEGYDPATPMESEPGEDHDSTDSGPPALPTGPSASTLADPTSAASARTSPATAITGQQQAAQPPGEAEAKDPPTMPVTPHSLPETLEEPAVRSPTGTHLPQFT